MLCCGAVLVTCGEADQPASYGAELRSPSLGDQGTHKKEDTQCAQYCEHRCRRNPGQRLSEKENTPEVLKI